MEIFAYRLSKTDEQCIGRHMKATDAASNKQMQHIIVIMLAENGQFVFTG